MKRKTLAFVLIIVIALFGTAWLVYNQVSVLKNQISELQTQNSELQDQNTNLQNQLRELQNQLVELQDKIGVARDVNITAFEWIGGFNPVGGLTLTHPVKVTIENMGVDDVSGLALTVKLLDIETGTEVGRGFTKQVGMIHAGVILEFSGDIWATIGSFSEDSAVCVATLTLGDMVLDEWTENLETVY